VGAERISPTAHYTGQCWLRNGLSHPALGSLQGRLAYDGLRPFNALAARLGAPTLEGLLLARHQHIDRMLEQEIAARGIGQVVEIAAGLSPRGWDFSRRHGARLAYVEADLPEMARHKQALLQRAGLLGARHRVVSLDALADNGPGSLAELVKTLDRSQGLAIITEGLLNYFPLAAVRGMWQRFAAALREFPRGLYLSDLHVRGENRHVVIDAGVALLSTFVRGKVHLHFDSASEAEGALMDAGFAQARLMSPAPQANAKGRVDGRGARLVRVIEARTGGS
jgi:O-methyltransferase involved in polyketide biosynthesis